jgi:hypothetical protein
MSNSPTTINIDFIVPPDEARAEESAEFILRVAVGEGFGDDESSVSGKMFVQLKVGGTLADQQDIVLDTDDTVQRVTLSNSFEESQDDQYPRTVTVEATADVNELTPSSTVDGDSTEVSVLEPPPEPVTPLSGPAGLGERKLSNTFDKFIDFSIRAIEYEDDATYVDSLYPEEQIQRPRNGRVSEDQYRMEFEYANPTIAIDGAGRFAKHEIIGGTTVRQKIGEDPLNFSINGICKRATANQIDSLRDAKTCVITSNRIPDAGSSVKVHIGSTSTEPMEDGGAADLVDGQLLYSFSINAIEVVR